MTGKLRQRAMRLLTVGLCASSITCSESTEPPPSSIAINPPSLTLEMGQQSQMSAVVSAALNALDVTPTWASSNPSVVSVTSGKSVTISALAVGTATIAATYGGVAGTATVTVIPPPVASVVVADKNVALLVGATKTLTAQARDAAGRTVNDAPIVWTTLSSTIASVSAGGVVTAVGAGSTKIVAASGGKTDTAFVTVTPVPVASVSIAPPSADIVTGATTTFTATLRDASSNVLTGRTIAWTTSDGAVATVSNAGVVTGGAAGNATITATSEGKSGAATVHVGLPPAAIAVTPQLLPFTSVQGGGNPNPQQITVTNSGGGVLSGLSAIGSAPWIATSFVGGVTTASPSAGVLVQPQTAGLTPGSYSGTVTISSSLANVASKSVSVTLNVAPPAVLVPTTIDALSLLNQSASIGGNVSQAPSVVVRASNGLPVSGVSVTFAIAAGGGAIVPSNGVVVTDANGIATLGSWKLGPTPAVDNRVTATAGSLTGSPITFHATGFGPSKIEIVSGDAQTAVAGNQLAQPIVVRVRDVNNTPVPSWQITFSATNGGSASPSPATSTATGDASTTWRLGPAAGSQTLTATLTEQAGTTHTVNFTATATGVVQVLKIAGDNQSGVTSSQLPTALKVRVLGAGSTPIPGASVAFAGSGSVSTTPVTTDAAGEASTFWTLPGTVGTGTATMVATAGGISASFGATVTAPPPGNISITAGNAQSGRGCTALPNQVVAKVVDGAAHPLAGLTVAFTPTGGGGAGATFAPTSAVTDVNGEAKSTWTLGSTLGSYTATASTSGLSPANLTATATLLCPNLGVFKGLITTTSGSGTTAPTPGAVTITPSAGGTGGSATAGADGRFTSGALPAGTYTLSATASVGAFTVTKRYQTTLAGGVETDVGTFTVVSTGFSQYSINTLFSPVPAAAVNVTVKIYDGSNGDQSGLGPVKNITQSVDPTGGQIDVNGINHGVYTVVVTAPGYVTARFEVTLYQDQISSITLKP